MAVLELPYGIEGLAPLKQLVKADESVAEVGEALDFVVIEFQKKIVRLFFLTLERLPKLRLKK